MVVLKIAAVAVLAVLGVLALAVALLSALVWWIGRGEAP
jgi:hypothetical protein